MRVEQQNPCDYLSIEEFFIILRQQVKEHKDKILPEDYDLVHFQDAIERRHVARILHQALLQICKEPDETDWSAAYELKDLYDCRTCVNHIAQIYAKGIMEAPERNVFQTCGFVTGEQAIGYIQKALHANLRVKPKEQYLQEKKREQEKEQNQEKLQDQEYTKKQDNLQKDNGSPILEIQRQEINDYLMKNEDAKLVDVRPKESYEIAHMPYSISVPLESIYQNPYAISQNRETPIILYCEKGYQSRLAAHILHTSGFSNIFVLA